MSVPLPSNIIAFTKDWSDVPTCTTHILREMGKSMPVLWGNSIGTRKPSLGSARDVGRIFGRLQRLCQRSELKENQLRVLSPVLVPKPESRLARWFNRTLMRWYVSREFPGAADRQLELWSFVPNAGDYVGHLRESKVVYYCVDDWSKFEYLDGQWIAAKEQELLAKADVIFATSRYLVRKCRTNAGDRVHYMPHGVEHTKFARALAQETPVPNDIASLPQPRIGFYGNIYPWIDFGLIEQLTMARPGWSFIMIGPISCDVSHFDGIQNVHFLGRREHDDLPAYCKGFDAAIIPYDMANPRMESVNPVKARELLAAGVPIVASQLPELEGMEPDVLCVNGVDAWIRALEQQALRADRHEISARRKVDDWTAKVQEIRQIVDQSHRD